MNPNRDYNPNPDRPEMSMLGSPPTRLVSSRGEAMEAKQDRTYGRVLCIVELCIVELGGQCKATSVMHSRVRGGSAKPRTRGKMRRGQRQQQDAAVGWSLDWGGGQCETWRGD